MKYLKLGLTIVLTASVLVLGAAACSSGAPSTQQWDSPPAMQIDTSKSYYAVFDTSMGSFKIELFADESPQTVNNFVFLTEQGFYNNTTFHRIIQTFMIQGGDPTGTGTGNPGYTIPDELPIKHPYAAGIVAMANTGRANSGGSQFFICTGDDAANLNKTPIYTEFGQVVEGMDVVEKIAAVPTKLGSDGNNSKPIDPPVIKKITIVES